MSENSTEKFYKHRANLEQVSTQLFELAASFHHTGNVGLGLKLQSLGRLVLQAKIGMAEAYDDILMNRVKEAFENSSTLLEATLTGALIAIDAQGGLDDDHQHDG